VQRVYRTCPAVRPPFKLRLLPLALMLKDPSSASRRAWTSTGRSFTETGILQIELRAVPSGMDPDTRHELLSFSLTPPNFSAAAGTRPRSAWKALLSSGASSASAPLAT
jgi:hypothetical protein